MVLSALFVSWLVSVHAILYFDQELPKGGICYLFKAVSLSAVRMTPID